VYKSRSSLSLFSWRFGQSTLKKHSDCWTSPSFEWKHQIFSLITMKISLKVCKGPCPYSSCHTINVIIRPDDEISSTLRLSNWIKIYGATGQLKQSWTIRQSCTEILNAFMHAGFLKCWTIKTF
jgi:hypothetical protein